MARKRLRKLSALGAAALALTPAALDASNHREAPITALDHKADITDLYAFVPNADPTKVTMILCVDPVLEPANGPTLFPFDPEIRYEIKIDNDHDAEADVIFRFRFSTEFQLPGVYTAVAGFGDSGATDPETGAVVVPPQIQDFQNPGLNLRQSYSVQMITIDDYERKTKHTLKNQDGAPFYVVPGNAGPRTMDYEALIDAAVHSGLNRDGVSVFAGTVDDPFFIDLGAAFDTGNFRTLGSGVPAVLTDDEDNAAKNFASDTISGYAVNAIAVEVPITMLTRTGEVHHVDDPEATIGLWATTSRPRITVRRSPNPVRSRGRFRQVQRFGNPLINELIIGIGSKDRYSMEQPCNDAQFAGFFLNPPIAQIVEAIYNELAPGALDVPEPTDISPDGRVDLLPLVTYTNPIAGAPNPVADLMRLNTAVQPTAAGQVNRLGVIGGDPAGFPNGRRLADDVVDIVLRVGVGGVLAPRFNTFPNNRLGDGVNVNDAHFRDVFPYLGSAPSGRNRRHQDPGERFPDGRLIPID